jgi:hypothetical protein
MDVHASPATLPELEEFLASFQVRFRRPEGKQALERYLTGLLTELPNKNCDTMAQAVSDTSEQRLQAFLTGASASVAHRALATRDQGVVAQKVRSAAMLAAHVGRPGSHWLVAGGAGYPRAA